MLRPLTLLSLLILWLFAATAQAGWFDDNVRDDDFLPVDEAFQASTWHDEDTLYVGFENAEGYYLYRHRFAIESLENGVTLGEPQLPPGEFKTDEFLGDVYVFYDRVVMAVPFSGTPDGGLDAAVTFQGCADAGLCYPPERLTLTSLPGSPPAAFSSIDASVNGDIAATTPPPDTNGSAVPLSEDSRFRTLLDDARPLTVLGLFFLAGLGLTFTPCVLPMVPILSSIIVGQNAGRARALGLSASYVGGMAITYALVGVLMGLFGAGLNLQARLQSPWVLIPFAALFVLFALAMFGLFDLKLSPRMAARVDGWQMRLQNSGPAGLALAGALSVAVVSPCVSAPLAGALVFISTTGDALMGGWALLSLALGMGVPLLLVGTFGTTLLPRSGAWMNGVKVAFGVLLLGIAIWLIARLLPGPVALLLWGALAVGSALALGALSVNQRQGWPRVRQAAGIVLLAWGVALVLGAARGGENPLRPLASLGTPSAAAETLAFTRVTTLAQLEEQLARAARLGRPAFVDFSADWCISCKIMERDVFPAPAVAERLADFHRIRADVTATDADSRALLDHFGLFGPPSLLFFAHGEELRQARIQGEVDAATFAAHLERLIQHLNADGQSA
ncbi:thiol:disulfide interchange protein DsbD [Modicisalibacter muralis]|uniref:Thiol:disulfide interchange protein DsbD n=1 Tax=Modicisalibacter muralis TaxID=119000 RepID=A0A1G9MQQ4_9GAMM|nr:protein-disulfide reductase DsbD [Halomonas muralis]SDL76616.1 thiol:disulfide interchange protein DsbD [Halomonas muralis]